MLEVWCVHSVLVVEVLCSEDIRMFNICLCDWPTGNSGGSNQGLNRQTTCSTMGSVWERFWNGTAKKQGCRPSCVCTYIYIYMCWHTIILAYRRCSVPGPLVVSHWVILLSPMQNSPMDKSLPHPPGVCLPASRQPVGWWMKSFVIQMVPIPK